MSNCEWLKIKSRLVNACYFAYFMILYLVLILSPS